MNSYILWDRYAKITFETENEIIIFERNKNDEEGSSDFEFETEYDITESSNIATITLWNLTDKIIKLLKMKTKVIIEAGYNNDGINSNIGVVYKGIIESVKGSWENADKKFEIICNTFNDEYKDTKINLKIAKGSKASTVINIILSKLTHLKKGEIKLGKDIIYKDGKTYNNNVKSIFKQIAEDTGSTFFITNGVVIFQKTKDVNRGIIEFDKNLFQDIDVNDGSYTLKCIFNPQLQEGYKLKIDLEDTYRGWSLKGEYLITKGKHVMSFNKEAYTELIISTKLQEKENEKEIEIVTGTTTKKDKSKDKQNKKKNKKETVKKKSKKKEDVIDKVMKKYNLKPGG